MAIQSLFLPALLTLGVGLVVASRREAEPPPQPPPPQDTPSAALAQYEAIRARLSASPASVTIGELTSLSNRLRRHGLTNEADVLDMVLAERGVSPTTPGLPPPTSPTPSRPLWPVVTCLPNQPCALYDEPAIQALPTQRLATGSALGLLEVRPNGWSRVIYPANGVRGIAVEAWIPSQFIETVLAPPTRPVVLPPPPIVTRPSRGGVLEPSLPPLVLRPPARPAPGGPPLSSGYPRFARYGYGGR